MRIHPFRNFSSFLSSSSLSFFSSVILIFPLFILIIHIKQHVLDERPRRESNSAPILIFHHSYSLSSSSLIIRASSSYYHPHTFIILKFIQSISLIIFIVLNHPYTPPHIHHPYHYLYQIGHAYDGNLTHKFFPHSNFHLPSLSESSIRSHSINPWNLNRTTSSKLEFLPTCQKIYCLLRS